MSDQATNSNAGTPGRKPGRMDGVTEGLAEAVKSYFQDRGVDPDEPVSDEAFDAAGESVVSAHNRKLSRISGGKTAERFRLAWEAYLLSSCEPVNHAGQDKALAGLKGINPVATLESAGAVLARLTFDEIPWQADQEELNVESFVRALDFSGVNGLGLEPKYEEVDVYLRIFNIVRTGIPMTPLIFEWKFDVLLDRILRVINQMMRTAVANGRDQKAVVHDLAAVGTESVTDHVWELPA